MNSKLPTGTVTFLFTDIEGSTKLAQEYREELPTLLARHKELLQQAIAAYRGFLFQIVGDSFSAAFDTAINALNAASEAQRLLLNEEWSPAPIKVRMGIHTGAAELAHDPSIQGPYSGYSTLAMTQRIMSAAHGGQILLSQITRDLVWEQLPAEVSLLDMGEHRLKDLLHPIRLYQASVADLPSAFPPLKTLQSFPHNLPVQLTSFVGREREIDKAKQLFSKTRLLMLIGPGGTGKTRLALKIAEDLLGSFADGVWIIELAPLTDPEFIPPAVAGVLELRELPNMPLINVIVDYLRAKQLLLILDNCEHLIQACAQLTDHLLRVCPQLKILASSREALGIAGETVYRVPSLSLPDPNQVTPETAMESEAARLFVERATAAQSKFMLTDQNASHIAQICRRLDGIPLALELASARIAIFSPEEIAAHLSDRFKLLTGGKRTALPRQQTLRAMIDWSYDLLSEEEQTLFRQLSVFAGGWTFRAAEYVCSGLDVLNLLTQLVNKSLVVVDENAQENPTRYRLLETIRQYARDKLLEVGDSEQARNRHLDYFLQFVEEAETYMNGPYELQWRNLLDAEYDNLRITLEWAMENDLEKALRLGGALHVFWERNGYEVEGRHFITEVLLRTRSPRESEVTREHIFYRAKALNALGFLCFGQGDNLASLKAFEESVTLFRKIGENRMLVLALAYSGMSRAFIGHREAAYKIAEEAITLAHEVQDKSVRGAALANLAGVLAITQGDLEKANPYYEEGIQLLREAGSHWFIAMTSFGFAIFNEGRGNYAEARSQFESCLPLFREMKDRHRLAMVRSELAHVERKEGRVERAEFIYRETILEWQRLGHRAAVAHELECFAFTAKAQEEDQRAVRLLGAAEALRENIAISMNPPERVEYDQEVNDLRVNMDKYIFDQAWAEGRALTMDGAITFALER